MSYYEKEFYLTFTNVNNKLELTNKGILSFFENIATFQSDEVGYGLKDLEKTKLSWVLLHWKVQILKVIKYNGKPVKVRTWSRGIKGACCMRDFELYDSDNNLCAICSSKWALIHLKDGLIKLTDEICNKYISDSKCVFGENFEFEKFIVPDNFSNAYEYTISKRDIDINNHMHNLYYLDLAYETLPANIYNNFNFKNFEIMYKSSALLGETVSCFYSNIDNEHFITIKSKDGSKLHSIIKFY